MRQRLNLIGMLIGCLLALAACAQPASVGIPTPNRTAPAIPVTAGAVGATNSPVPPPPTDTPAPQPPAPTATSPAPLPTPLPPPETPTVPATPAPSGSGAGAGGNTGGTVTCNQQVIHIVRPGENLFRIALRYKTTIYAIARLNGITNVRVIRTGQRLRIRTCTGRQGADPPDDSGNNGSTYVVRPGDRLFRIALRFGVTVGQLMAANAIYSSIIVPGQVLVIP